MEFQSGSFLLYLLGKLKTKAKSIVSSTHACIMLKSQKKEKTIEAPLQLPSKTLACHESCLMLNIVALFPTIIGKIFY